MTFAEGLVRADPNTIQDKVLVGYQGWFTCAGDGPPLDPAHHGWLHWFNSPIPSGGRPNVDLWPDVSEYDPSELYPAPGLTSKSGDPVHLFSSRHPKTVQRHFHWMALHGVDGAFLQRFAGQCEIKPGNIAIRDLRDEIGDRVQEAAESEGRVFAIMYDVSGVSPDKIQSILEQDWTHLVVDKHVLDSPNYLRESDRPVVALWGFGLNGRNHTPELVRAIAGFFRSFTPGGVYLVAGTPGHWRTSTSDADRNPEFVKVWTECFDAISPWTVGRFGNEEEADRWGQGRLKADAEYLATLASEGGRKVDYIPVVLPGGSGFNLSEGKWRMNDMRRNGGEFLWRQLYNAQRAGVRTIYGAMWDEYDEGTVFMPVVSHASQLPVHPSFRFLALDVDGYELPSDWYMRIAGLAAEAFHGERTLGDTLPVEELKDYWRTRPRYEGLKSVAVAVAAETVQREERSEREKKQTEVDAITHSLNEWQLADGSTDVPPPYTLEDASPRAPPGGGAPTIRRDSRPSWSGSVPGSVVAGGAVAAVAVGAAALAASGRPSPPPVNMSSRPAPRLTTTRPSYHAGMPQSPPLAGPASPPIPYGYDARKQYSQPYTQGQDHGRASGGVVYSPPAGPPPDARGRGRSRSRSRSRSHSRSHSRSRKHGHRRSRSRSSSRGRTHSFSAGVYPAGGAPVHGHGHGHGHGHTQSLGPQGHGGYAPGPHGPQAGYGPGPTNVHAPGHAHALGHSQSYSPGSSYDAYPGAGAGAGGGGGGGGGGHYAPVGYAHGPSGPGYGRGQPGPQGGYGYGQGYPGPAGPQGQGQGGQGYGYTPHPSGNYPAPGAYPAGAGGPGGGGVQGGLATALQAVEGIAGRQTRQQLEKTVGTLLNKFR